MSSNSHLSSWIYWNTKFPAFSVIQEIFEIRLLILLDKVFSPGSTLPEKLESYLAFENTQPAKFHKYGSAVQSTVLGILEWNFYVDCRSQGSNFDLKSSSSGKLVRTAPWPERQPQFSDHGGNADSDVNGIPTTLPPGQTSGEKHSNQISHSEKPLTSTCDLWVCFRGSAFRSTDRLLDRLTVNKSI